MGSKEGYIMQNQNLDSKFQRFMGEHKRDTKIIKYSSAFHNKMPL